MRYKSALHMLRILKRRRAAGFSSVYIPRLLMTSKMVMFSAGVCMHKSDPYALMQLLRAIINGNSRIGCMRRRCPHSMCYWTLQQSLLLKRKEVQCKRQFHKLYRVNHLRAILCYTTSPFLE